MSTGPDTATRKRILEAKLADHQAHGYEHSVNAIISEDLEEHEAVQEAAETSRKHYQAARKIAILIAELPDEDKAEQDTPGTEEEAG